MKTESLFRSEAIKRKKDNPFGEVFIIPPTQIRILSYFILSMIMITVFFLLVGDYPKKQNVTGVIFPYGGIQKIFSPFKGTLKSIKVAEGDNVLQGQILGTIVTSHNLPENETVIEELKKQFDAIKVKKEIIINDAEVKREMLKNNIIQIKNEIQENSILFKILEKRSGIAKEQLTDYDKLLKKNLTSKDKHLAAEDSVLYKKSEYHQLKIKNSTLVRELNNEKYDNEKIQIEMNRQLQDLEEKRSSIIQKLFEIKNQRSFLIKARSNGVITYIQSSINETVDPERPVIIILPSSSKLEAKLYIPTRSAGFVRKGQKILIKYNAFPYEKYGVYKGIVKSIGKIALFENEYDTIQSTKEPVFKTIAELETCSIKVHNGYIRLKPGMSFNAEIILDHRSLLELILEPLYRNL